MTDTMEYDEIVIGLQKMAGWSEFAASLLRQLRSRGQLSAKQWDAAEAAIVRAQQRDAQRPKQIDVDMIRIETVLFTARANGLKKPVFRAGGMVFSLAPSTGRNAGGVYIKVDGEYAGKLMSGRLYPVQTAPQWLPDRVAEVAADPRGKAIDYGRETGVCACCGRTLTDPKSIEMGIGPICAEHFGL